MVGLATRAPHLYRILVNTRRVYRRAFAVLELETTPLLQWMTGASLLFFYVTFFDWTGSTQISVETAESGRAVCWPFFQHCSDYYFLHSLPWGYSQTTFYMVLFAMMLTIVWAMWRNHWTLAHALMLILFVWDALITLIFSFNAAAPYGYYHLILTAVLLFASQKEFFLKISFILMYFLSATTKIDSTWILGTYFSTLKLGLPLFPAFSTALLTNLVMGMQMIGCWFLVSKRTPLRYAALAYFAFFHWYSGIFVLYKYPTITLPSLLILFGPLYRQTPIPFGRKTVVGWIILLLVCVFQILGFAAPGDRRLTLEGNKFGMFMFEANHQCIVTVTSYIESDAKPENRSYPLGDCSDATCLVLTTAHREGSMLVRTDRYESGNSWNRCYPYVWWSRLHRQCELKSNTKRIGFTMEHSINGGPFYRIVDLPNICDIAYKPFGPNTWIMSPPDAPITGYPVQNVYRY